MKKQIHLHPKTYVVAINEARVFRDIAFSTHHTFYTNNSIKLEYALPISVMFGFSIELYLKSFMLIVRNGTITKEHELMKLYSEFPKDLVTDFETRYQQHDKSNFYIIGIANKLSANAPNKPSENVPPYDFKTFKGALSSVSNLFVDARYFFENINEQKYSVFWYNFEIPNALTEILDNAFVDYQKKLKLI